MTTLLMNGSTVSSQSQLQNSNQDNQTYILSQKRTVFSNLEYCTDQRNGAFNLEGSMSFYLVNATSLAKNNAIQLLGLDITQYCPHIAIVTETWFTSKHDDSYLSISNYALYRRDRVKRKGGAVSLPTCDINNCEVLSYSNGSDSIEILWLKCYFNNQVYLVACCYHPPNPRYESKLFLEQLINGVEQFTAANADTVANEYIIVAGDFNTLDSGLLYFRNSVWSYSNS